MAKLLRNVSGIFLAFLIVTLLLLQTSAPILPAMGQIAFSGIVQDQSSLSLLDVNRDIQHALYHGAESYHALSWSSNGMKFAFAETDATNQNQHLRVTDFATLTTQTLTTDTASSEIISPAHWSDTSDQLVYPLTDSTDTTTLFSVDFSSTSPLEVMPFNENATLVSYSGDEVRWIEVSRGQVTLFAHNLTTRDTETIKTWDAGLIRNWEPVVSPDGKKFIISGKTNTALDDELYLFDLSTDDIINLTNRRTHNDSSPAWSHDGERIAYKSLNGTQNLIAIMNADGSDSRVVYKETVGRVSQIRMSPDGALLAFVTNRPLEYRLCILVLADESTYCPIITRKIDDVAWRPA